MQAVRDSKKTVAYFCAQPTLQAPPVCSLARSDKNAAASSETKRKKKRTENKQKVNKK